MTIILGGGISGLSAAYYALNTAKISPIILLESSNRLGGWIQSNESSNGIIFEKGPRTIRCSGLAGKNTLNFLEDLQLNDKIIPIKSDHPSAKNRMIYSRNKLHLLPNSLLSTIKTNSLFNRPLASFLLKDLTAPMIPKDDESIYNFIERRFGKDISDYLISPMICGICAGDAQTISVKFLMKSLFEKEQKYGSITKGLIKELFKKKNINNIEYKSNLIKRAETEKWVLWGLKGGLEELPRSLEKHLLTRGVDIQLNSPCEKLVFHSNHIELTVNGKIKKCSRIISSLPAKNLAKLLKEQHPDLSDKLRSIPMVTVAVVNLQFADNILPMNAFGFLVPPKENLPILGVIFDSCIFPKDSSSTVLTVMMGGAWFENYFGRNPTDENLLNIAIKQVKNILNIKNDPITFNVDVLKDCIPQHVVGHSERLNHIRDYISSRRIPLALCGSSYQGVGINDVILSAKEAVSDIVQYSNEH